jgi:hypothetical protein
MMRAIAASLALLLIGAANSQSINYPTPLTIIAGAGAPFAGVVVTDPNVGATTDTVTIILSGSAGGVLSGPGLTGSNPYILAGTPQTITGLLQALTYAPAAYGNSQAEFDLTVVSTAITTFGSATGAVQVQNINLTNEVPFPAPIGTFTPRNFKGVNIAGAENAYPSSSQYNYIYPAAIELDYWASKGIGLIRMPLQIRRLQPQSYGMLDPIGRTDEPAVAGSTPGTQTNLLAIKAVLDRALTDGLYVVLDPHDYGYIQDTNTNTARLIGADPEATGQFIDWWLRMATVFKNYPNVVFGLMNEPHAQTAAQWQSGAVAAINAIAQVTTSRWVFVPGTAYTGANSWVQSGNGAAWAGYVPPTGMRSLRWLWFVACDRCDIVGANQRIQGLDRRNRLVAGSDLPARCHDADELFYRKRTHSSGLGLLDWRQQFVLRAVEQSGRDLCLQRGAGGISDRAVHRRAADIDPHWKSELIGN